MPATKPPETGEMPALDATDLHILKLLQQNARMTIREIAGQVHLSATPVNERIRRMEASGVIRQYAAIVNAARLNKGLMTICYVSIREHSKQAGSHFIQSILAMEEVVECLTISGEFDFMLKVVSENMDAYYNFHVNKLGELQNIGNVQSVFVMGVIKQTHQLVF